MWTPFIEWLASRMDFTDSFWGFHSNRTRGEYIIKDCLIHITIDGYSGCCKSLLGKTLAKNFGLVYINSGLIYRFATLQLINNRIHPALLTDANLDFLYEISLLPDGTILWHGTQYDETVLESEAIQEQVSVYAQNEYLRQVITCWIRQFASEKSVVMDGRDTGTEILPNAEIKIFISSTVEHRLNNWKRKQLEQFNYIDPVKMDLYIQQLSKRDHDDITRKISPLRCPPDALQFRSDIDGFEGILARVSAAVEQYKLGH